MTLGEAIRQYREENGNMSKRAFARKCGLSVTYISSLENNKTQRGNVPTPTIETYRAIAKALCMDVEDLIRMVDDKIIVNENKGLSEARKQLLDAVDDMNEEQLKKLLQIIEAVKGM